MLTALLLGLSLALAAPAAPADGGDGGDEARTELRVKQAGGFSAPAAVAGMVILVLVGAKGLKETAC